MPENGYPTNSRYGLGWGCHYGFREANGQCERVQVPENAYLVESEYGRGWMCERGFREAGSSCDRIELPANAHLDFSGNNWDCNSRYRKRLEGCVLVSAE